MRERGGDRVPDCGSDVIRPIAERGHGGCWIEAEISLLPAGHVTRVVAGFHTRCAKPCALRFRGGHLRRGIGRHELRRDPECIS